MAEVALAGVPALLAAKPVRTFRAKDAGTVYAHPRPQLARLEQQRVIHRLAYGLYVVVPQEHAGTGWRPTLEVAAAGIAAAIFGAREAPLMSVSAARVHGAIPRALATAVVAAPRHHDPIPLLDRSANVIFVRRDTGRLSVEPATTELGPVLVTGIEQTVLDLARRPSVGVADDQAAEAIRALLPLCDEEVIVSLAGEQRLHSALMRARRYVS